ncbi:MAG: DUF1176 domain-containing protein [Rhizobium sp.]|nr:DUF1176 domain-containing protein [Rhizobium sp.]
MRFWTTTVVALAVATGVSCPAAAEDPSIDLKLFGKHEIAGGLSACHLAFWQKDRDPDTDKYAYLIYMPFDEYGAPTEATIEIGKEKIALSETARGDTNLPSRLGYRLYSSADHATHVIVQIEEATGIDALVTIDKARVTVVRDDLPPFVAGARGVIGCPLPPKAATAEQPVAASPADADPAPAEPSASSGVSVFPGPDGLPFGPAQDLAASSDVPNAVRREIAAYAPDECADPSTLAYGGARYALNDAFTLWEVPCFLGAYLGSSVFAITQNPPTDWVSVLTLPNPPALEGENNVGLMNPQVLPERGLMISTSVGRGEGDCGTYQVFRLMDAPGETFELQLLEYREKVQCDGVQVEPTAWPLQFRAEN